MNCAPESHVFEIFEENFQAEQQKRLKSSTRIQELQVQLNQLTENLSDSYQRTEQLERAWQVSTKEVAKLRHQSFAHKVDDRTLKTMYEEIIYSVGNWASNYCEERDATFHDADLYPLTSLTQHYRQYVASEILRPVLIQSFVMSVLVENILKYSDSEPNGLLWLVVSAPVCV